MPRRIIVVSGAGLSVDSGIRAFRTDTVSGRAMWDEYDIAEVCDIGSFNAGYRAFKDPSIPSIPSFDAYDEHGKDLYTKTHEFYGKRRQELQTVEPNIAHLRIAEWFQRYPGQVVNVTTNVDNLLERAGVPRDEVYHLHGYLTEMRIRDKGHVERLVDIGYKEFDIDDHEWCKPNVTFFGETAPWYMGQINIFDTLTMQDLVIVVGCSNKVIDFNWEIFPALNMGTRMVVVNPNVSYLDQEAYAERGVLVYRAGAAEVFGNKNFIDVIEKHLEG